MRNLLLAAPFAAAIVVAPVVLHKIFPAGGMYVVGPLGPGLFVVGLLDHAGFLEAMDSSGDFTSLAAVVMYVMSFISWYAVSWAGVVTLRRASRAHVV